jgi:hypothetical protein
MVLFSTDPDRCLPGQELAEVEATLPIVYPDHQFRFGFSPVCTSTHAVIQISGGGEASRSSGEIAEAVSEIVGSRHGC